jgi:hypothetical protein
MAIGMMTFISGSGSVWDSKKELENHAAMVALYFMYYNFERVHQTLRVTSTMEASRLTSGRLRKS